MKVKYLYNDEQLTHNGVYNVFTIQEWSNGDEKYYIAESDKSGKYYITPFDSDKFEIVDSKISKFWHYGVDMSGNKTIGILEVINTKHFWNQYYDDDENINNVLDMYYRLGKEELFNV